MVAAVVLVDRAAVAAPEARAVAVDAMVDVAVAEAGSARTLSSRTAS